jgi:hypothetical protein
MHFLLDGRGAEFGVSCFGWIFPLTGAFGRRGARPPAWLASCAPQ